MPQIQNSLLPEMTARERTFPWLNANGTIAPVAAPSVSLAPPTTPPRRVGMFDDLIPQAPARTGMFDDLIPTAVPQSAPATVPSGIPSQPPGFTLDQRVTREWGTMMVSLALATGSDQID